MQHNIAIIGVGMAGVVCARTLRQAGHTVTLFEKSRGLGGRRGARTVHFLDSRLQYLCTVPGPVLVPVHTVSVLEP